MNTEPELLWLARVLAPAVAAGSAASILTLSYFPVPIMRSLAIEDDSTGRALDHLRGLFSSGSYIYPNLAALSAGLYSLLAYYEPAKRNGYIAAAVGCVGIAPFTTLIMFPSVNKKLIDLHEKRKKVGADEMEKHKERVDELLKYFAWQNAVRAGIMAAGAFAGLYTALV